MIKARLHKGSLDESIRTAQAFVNVADMKKWFVNNYNNMFSAEDIVIDEEAVYDSRIGWNTRYVCTRRYGEKDDSVQCIGMCDLDGNRNECLKHGDDMVNLLNDKLYNQYYPLKTEEEKNEFLNSNSTEIYRMIRDIGSVARNELYVIKHEYVKKIKPTVSFLGNPKYRNIAHNEYLANKMLMDKRVKNITEKLPDLDSLACKIIYHEYENITLDELNSVLRLKNFNKHKTGMMCVLSLILLIVCTCIFL